MPLLPSRRSHLAKLDRYRKSPPASPIPWPERCEAQSSLPKASHLRADGSITPGNRRSGMLMELAYRLAVEDTPFMQKIRRDAIVLITPIVEVDGHDRMVDIYMQHKKHPDQPPIR